MLRLGSGNLPATYLSQASSIGPFHALVAGAWQLAVRRARQISPTGGQLFVASRACSPRPFGLAVLSPSCMMENDPAPY